MNRSHRRGGIGRFFAVLSAPCREHGRLMSLELDGEATRAERWGLRVHYLVCAPCRRLARDLRWITGAVRGARPEPPIEPPAMPDDVRARLEAISRR